MQSSALREKRAILEMKTAPEGAAMGSKRPYALLFSCPKGSRRSPQSSPAASSGNSPASGSCSTAQSRRCNDIAANAAGGAFAGVRGGAIRLGVQHRCSAISGQVGNQMHVDLRACEVLVSEQVLDFDER